MTNLYPSDAGTLIGKLDLITEIENNDEDDLYERFNQIKRKVSAPAGLTKTLFSLYLNRKKCYIT